MNKPRTIAIDGPAASGKSTLAERLAKLLGYIYFDTGIMYRAVTLAALKQLENLGDEIAVTQIAKQVSIDVLPPSVEDGRSADVLLDGIDITWEIRTPEVDVNVSRVSAYLGVREAMTSLQRKIGQRGNVVMVGRDIGTVVMPDADMKIYLEASVEERARRRSFENLARGEEGDYDEILAALKKRDYLDSSRTIAPLKPAEDAIHINTDNLSIEEMVEKVLDLITR